MKSKKTPINDTISSVTLYTVDFEIPENCYCDTPSQEGDSWKDSPYSYSDEYGACNNCKTARKKAYEEAIKKLKL